MDDKKLSSYYDQIKAMAPQSRRGGLGTAGSMRKRKGHGSAEADANFVPAVPGHKPMSMLYNNFVPAGYQKPGTI